MNGVDHRILYGSTVAAPAWKEYMDVAVEGMPVQDFGAPDQSLIGRAPAPSVPTPSDDDDDSSDGGGNRGGNRGGNGNGGNGNNDDEDDD